MHFRAGVAVHEGARKLAPGTRAPLEHSFMHAVAPADEWVVTPLEVRRGTLPWASVRCASPDPRILHGSMAVFRYAVEHRGTGELDATVACRSSTATIIAWVCVVGNRVLVEEDPAAQQWLRRLGNAGTRRHSAGGHL